MRTYIAFKKDPKTGAVEFLEAVKAHRLLEARKLMVVKYIRLALSVTHQLMVVTEKDFTQAYGDINGVKHELEESA